MLIDEVTDPVIPHSVSLHQAPFWIQIHNVPLQYMTKSIGEAISTHLGDCIMIDSDEEGLCLGKFMRVRVKLDVRRPLRRGMRLALNDHELVWVEFQYEKLPDFCFRCGLLGR